MINLCTHLSRNHSRFLNFTLPSALLSFPIRCGDSWEGAGAALAQKSSRKQEPSVPALADLSWAKSQDELAIEFRQKQKDAQGIPELQLDGDERPILLLRRLGCALSTQKEGRS
ncbi:hypothetical protein AV530_009017 [Patagioenas fasciata monilis]|uniref:Uncharacterized protein n=1 Tax=Patagioenas fasciata monilis TaxID=372326 RepID=A0A1V4KSG1_PATFA|nr:hypothetical protein AV530_009017 [Patagioenas fasciata monilis]